MRQASKLITDIVKYIIEYKLSLNEVDDMFLHSPLIYDPHTFNAFRYYTINNFNLNFKIYR